MKKKNRNFMSLSFIGLCLLGANSFVYAEELGVFPLKTVQAFKFEQFPANVAVTSAIAKPILTTKLAKQYKTVITLSMAEPANFAGHYRVVTWGCGTDCRGFAILNKLSGVAYTLPGVEYVAGIMGNEEERLDFKSDSRLFVISGLVNDETEGKFYYLWERERLKLLAKMPLVKQSYSD